LLKMSIVASESTNKTGLVEMLDQALGTNNDSFPLAQKIAKINLALDEALAIIFKVSKSGWQFDDSNHSSDPVLTANLVSGTRAYDFSQDAGGNLVLDVYRVMISGSDGVFRVIDPVSQRTDPKEDIDDFIDDQNTAGTPTKYDKYGMKISLDPIPNYNYTNGLKLFINRQASYFTVDSTSQVAGIDGLCHDFLYLKPAYEWARDHGLHNTKRLFRDLQLATIKLEKRYGAREKDTPRRMTPNIENTR